MLLENQTIVIISPQAWGAMFLAKHHYAVALARRGNRVFFLNPPDQKRISFPSFIELKQSNIHPNLQLIEHRLFFPSWLRFHATWLFHALMWFHIQHIRSRLKIPIDIVWSFDLNNIYPFRFWDKKSFKIFHPIDEPNNHHAFVAANDADVIFSVTNEILDKYSGHLAPRHFIHHGVEEVFFEHSNPDRPVNHPIHCGLSGNFTRADLDRLTLLQIIQDNPQVMFECWGSYTAKDSNIGGDDSFDLQQFVARLQTFPNVILHGPTPPDQLARELHRMDVLLICYDIQKDQSRGTNYHKVMEYLSTGKVIVSNNITTYSDRPDLITMTSERDNNKQLPALFNQVIQHIYKYNAPSKQRARIEFARENTYTKQLDRIAVALNR